MMLNAIKVRAFGLRYSTIQAHVSLKNQATFVSAATERGMKRNEKILTFFVQSWQYDI